MNRRSADGQAIHRSSHTSWASKNSPRLKHSIPARYRSSYRPGSAFGGSVGSGLVAMGVPIAAKIGYREWAGASVYYRTMQAVGNRRRAGHAGPPQDAYSGQHVDAGRLLLCTRLRHAALALEY